jgi:hypothetical protein
MPWYFHPTISFGLITTLDISLVVIVVLELSTHNQVPLAAMSSF